MKLRRNKVFFNCFPIIDINPTTAYIKIGWLKWNVVIAMRNNKLSNIILKITDLNK